MVKGIQYAKYYGVVITAITNAIDSKYKSCGFYWKRSRLS